VTLIAEWRGEVGPEYNDSKNSGPVKFLLYMDRPYRTTLRFKMLLISLILSYNLRSYPSSLYGLAHLDIMKQYGKGLSKFLTALNYLM
jgi:hypothetical protein